MPLTVSSYQAELNELRAKLYGANIHQAVNVMTTIETNIKLAQLIGLNTVLEERIVKSLSQLSIMTIKEK